MGNFKALMSTVINRNLNQLKYQILFTVLNGFEITSQFFVEVLKIIFQIVGFDGNK